MDIRMVTTEKELKDAYEVRKKVFVEEQQVPIEMEIDELEDEAIHFVGYDGLTPIAASRLRVLSAYGKLERICVLKSYRGQSFGKKIIEQMEKEILRQKVGTVKLNAQTHAKAFYVRQGYRLESEDIFDDAGIPHVAMIKNLTD